MQVQWEGMGRPLVNPIEIETDRRKIDTVKTL